MTIIETHHAAEAVAPSAYERPSCTGSERR
jgi:hypothetical protein